MDQGPAAGERPRLTITIPYFRGIDYLREAIESVQRQTLVDWELIVVDDHSPEPAEQLVLALHDPRVSYVRNEQNLGLSGNWNRCLTLATTPLVTILHADDRLLPDYAATVVAAAAAHPDVAAVFTDATIIDAAGAPVQTLADQAKRHLPRPARDHVVHGDAGLAALLFGNYIVCPTLCLRSPLVGPDPFRAEWRFVPDWELTTRLLLEGQSLYAVRTPLLEYRRHGGTETARMTSDSSRFAEEISLMRLRSFECTERDLPRSARTARRRLTVRGHLFVLAVLDVTRGRWRSARDKAQMLWSDLRDGGRVGVDHPDAQQGQEETGHHGL